MAVLSAGLKESNLIYCPTDSRIASASPTIWPRVKATATWPAKYRPTTRCPPHSMLHVPVWKHGCLFETISLKTVLFQQLILSARSTAVCPSYLLSHTPPPLSLWTPTRQQGFTHYLPLQSDAGVYRWPCGLTDSQESTRVCWCYREAEDACDCESQRPSVLYWH